LKDWDYFLKTSTFAELPWPVVWIAECGLQVAAPLSTNDLCTKYKNDFSVTKYVEKYVENY